MGWVLEMMSIISEPWGQATTSSSFVWTKSECVLSTFKSFFRLHVATHTQNPLHRDNVWCMLHSGSRGVGNRIGSTFIEVAKKDMKKHIKNLPDADLAYLNEGTEHFNDYIEAVEWAQQFARMNRMLMMESFVEVLREDPRIPGFEAEVEAVNCHHNYVSRETHFGESVYVTRKGALR